MALPREGCALSAESSFHDYAVRRRPVVIALPAAVGPPCRWTLSYFKSQLASHSADLKQRVAGSCEWAGLERAAGHVGGRRVGDFIVKPPGLDPETSLTVHHTLPALLTLDQAAKVPRVAMTGQLSRQGAARWCSHRKRA